MSEHEPREPLEVQIAKKFKTVTTDSLIRRIQRAADFGYDDEQYELNRRLRENGQTWRWNGDKVEVIRQVTDNDLIDQAIAEWREGGERDVIPDTIARIIASQWHGGQTSELYSFVSTGRINLDGLQPEMRGNYLEASETDRVLLEVLGHYFLDMGDRDVQEGWHDATRWGGER